MIFIIIITLIGFVKLWRGRVMFGRDILYYCLCSLMIPS